MTAPSYSIVQYPHHNPGASSDLRLTLIVVPNTSPEQIVANIRANTALPLEWLTFKPETGRPAIMVGGGPSAADYLEEIRAMQGAGGTVFAMNGSSAWLRQNGIVPDWQVIADAKEETASLVDPEAKGHLFSSAVNSATMAAVPDPIVWHPVIAGIEECFPEDRRKAEYSIVGGTSAGTHAMCAAYVLGHRVIHCFGYDSSHRGDAGHAYAQPMNDSIPVCEVPWAGKTYRCSIAMKAQAEHFQLTAREMVGLGVTLIVHGDGLLPAMWNTPPEDLTERDKYRLVWQYDAYRQVAPGEVVASTFLEVAKPAPGSQVIDFGCGTGRASLALKAAGLDPLLVDFADNCRDLEAVMLPFLEADLTEPIPLTAPYGFCTDVMEHIPTGDVPAVLRNIFSSAEAVFFQISTVPDSMGALIGRPLHLTVRDHLWWRNWLEEMGTIQWEKKNDASSLFLATRH